MSTVKEAINNIEFCEKQFTDIQQRIGLVNLDHIDARLVLEEIKEAAYEIEVALVEIHEYVSKGNK